MKLKPLMNKKGSILDPIILIVVAFVVLFFFGFMVYAFGIINGITTNIDANVGNVSISETFDATLGQFNTGLQLLRIIAIAIVFGMIFTIFVSNYLTKSHPIFYVVYILLAGVLFLISVLVSNAYETIINASSTSFGPTLQSFTAMHWIMMHLPSFIAIVTLLGAFFLFMGKEDRTFGGIQSASI